MKRNKMDFDFNGRYARHVARVAAEREAIDEAREEIARNVEPKGVCRVCGEDYDKYADDFEHVCPQCEMEAEAEAQAEACRTYFQRIA